MKYKGIELEGLDKDVKLAHSRFTEADEGTDWIDKLLTCDKAALMPTQFHEVSALSSVINMDYQICNGGIGQYVTNGYHEYRAPYSDDDVEHYGAVEQVYMLRALADFGDNVFPYADSCNREVRQWANLFDRIDFDSVDYYDEVIGEYVSPEAVSTSSSARSAGTSTRSAVSLVVSARADTSTATAMSALCASPRRWVSATSSASASWTPGTAPVARSMSSRARESSSCSTRIRASSSPSSWRVRVRSRVITSLSVRMCRIG